MEHVRDVYTASELATLDSIEEAAPRMHSMTVLAGSQWGMRNGMTPKTTIPPLRESLDPLLSTSKSSFESHRRWRVAWVASQEGQKSITLVFARARLVLFGLLGFPALFWNFSSSCRWHSGHHPPFAILPHFAPLLAQAPLFPLFSLPAAFLRFSLLMLMSLKTALLPTSTFLLSSVPFLNPSLSAPA